MSWWDGDGDGGGRGGDCSSYWGRCGMLAQANSFISRIQLYADDAILFGRLMKANDTKWLQQTRVTAFIVFQRVTLVPSTGPSMAR